MLARTTRSLRAEEPAGHAGRCLQRLAYQLAADRAADGRGALPNEVREGEYIQVIDVQGRQCSDFLAFHRGQAGERPRAGAWTGPCTLIGAAYPLPGLYDVLRRRHGPARARRRDCRPPRHLRARTHAPLLRGHGLSRHAQTACRTPMARWTSTGSRRVRLGGRQLLQHPDRGGQHPRRTSPGRGRATTS